MKIDLEKKYRVAKEGVTAYVGVNIARKAEDATRYHQEGELDFYKLGSKYELNVGEILYPVWFNDEESNYVHFYNKPVMEDGTSEIDFSPKDGDLEEVIPTH